MPLLSTTGAASARGFGLGGGKGLVGGLLLKFANAQTTNNIQTDTSLYDRSTGITYGIWNYLSGPYGVQVASISNDGTVNWAKRYSVSGTDMYVLGPVGYGPSYIYILAYSGSRSVILRISKADGSLYSARKINQLSNTGYGMAVDSTNDLVYYSWDNASSGLGLACINGSNLASYYWGPTYTTYSGGSARPEQNFNLSYNSNNGKVYANFRRYDATGNYAQTNIVEMDSSGQIATRIIGAGSIQDVRNISFDGTDLIMYSNYGYFMRWTSDLSSNTWRRSVSFGSGFDSTSPAGNVSYPRESGGNGRFTAMDNTGPTVAWAKTIVNNGQQEMYFGLGDNGNASSYFAMFEDAAATGKNAYWMKFPTSGAFTGTIGTAYTVSNRTVTNNSLSTLTSTSVSTSTSSYTLSTSDFGYLITTTDWTPTTVTYEF